MFEVEVSAGQKFPAFGSRFPFPFEVVIVNCVKPEFTILETLPDYSKVRRVVPTSVFLHSAKVWKLRLTPGKGDPMTFKARVWTGPEPLQSGIAKMLGVPVSTKAVCVLRVGHTGKHQIVPVPGKQ